MRSRSASKIAFSAILIGAVSVVLWWSRHRPSFLLYQAHDQLDQGNQSGVIAEYRRLLVRPGLAAVEEMKLRKALGGLYVSALQESTDVDVLPGAPGYQAENPFIDLAKKEFQRVLELDSVDSDAHYYLGRILWAQRLENYALEEFEKSRRADPKNPAPLRYLAQVNLERGNPAAARDEALQSLALDPSSDDARLILASCFAEMGETSDALDEFEKLSPAFRASSEAQSQYALLLMKANRWEEARQIFERPADRVSQDGRFQLAYGRYLLKRGRQREAGGAFAQAAALMPRSAWPLAWSVQAYFQNGDCDQAQRVSQLLVESLPRWPWSHWARAASDLCRGDADEALQSLNEALRLSPDFSEALELQSHLLLDMGRYTELGNSLRPLIDKNHHRSFAYTMMAESLLDQKKFDMAADVADTAVKLDWTNLDAFVALGDARFNMGDRGGAQQAFENARRWDGSNPRVQARVALIERSGSDLRQNLSALAREWPDGADIWCLLGLVCERQRDFSSAVDAYQSAAALKPYLLKAQLGLVSSFNALRKPEQAGASLDRAFQINPHNGDVLEWRMKLRRR